MPEIKVIIQSTFGVAELTHDFTSYIETLGFTGLWSIEARTNRDIIDYVEKRHAEGVPLTEHDYMAIRVETVDTSKQWAIVDYDGSESINYIEIEVLNEALNYVKLK